MKNKQTSKQRQVKNHKDLQNKSVRCDNSVNSFTSTKQVQKNKCNFFNDLLIYLENYKLAWKYELSYFIFLGFAACIQTTPTRVLK